MRILHIFNEINYSGAEIMYANAAPLFQEQGFELFAISTGNDPGNFVKQFEEADIKIFHKPFERFSKNPFYIYNYLKSICVLIKENDIDVVHIHRFNVFFYFSFCAFLMKKKAVMTLHNVFKAHKITWIKHYVTRLIARRLFNLTFQSIGESVYLNEKKYFKNKTILVNNWYDNKRFFPEVDDIEKSKIREKLNLDDNTFVIISTGSCSNIKNHSDIIRVLPILTNQISCIYIHLGAGSKESDEKALAIELGVEKNILFLGNKSNVRDYLVASDVFLMTSKFEGLSIASIEAMACKLPSILYNSPGLRDLIKNDDNGLLIEPDYKILAQNILFLKQNLAIARQKALSAYENVRLNYFMPNSVSKIIAIYKN